MGTGGRGRHYGGFAFGPGGAGAWGGPGAGPGFRWRFFDRGDLKFVILRLLRERPRHGYEVMRAREEESFGCYRASAGSVYPTLQMLEDQGFVVAEDREGKRVYSITDAGRAHLEQNRDVLDDIAERVSSFTDRFVRPETGDLAKTFAKLAQSTFERAVKYPGDSDVLGELKSILERALHEVEGVRSRRSEI